MSLLSLLVQPALAVFCGRGRGSVLSWTLAVNLAILSVGTGATHAQECDPTEKAKLLSNNGAINDRFGWAVSINGHTAVIGAYQDDDNGFNSGSVSVFTRTGGVWTQQAILLPDDGAENDQFGRSVSIIGDTVIIGAHWDDDNGFNSGSAYIFTRTGGVWTQQAKLLPDDGALQDDFGFSVSLSGDTAVIGASGDDDNGSLSGSAYVFTRTGSVWTQQAKLLPDDGAAEDLFGSALSISGETVVIGGHANDDNGFTSGSAYIFTRTGSVWDQQAKLLPDDGAVNDQFGSVVSISGDLALIGAFQDDDNGTDTGSAYVFSRSVGVWTQQAKLLPDDGAAVDRFGNSVSISGTTAIVGVRRDSDGSFPSGSAYVFTQSEGVWTPQPKLLPANGVGFDGFGWFVSLDDDTAVIGAHWDDDPIDDAGSAYVFNLGCNTCPADLDGNGVLDTLDFLAFLGAWSSGEPLADWNDDTTIDTRDILAYLADWNAGCP